MITCTAKVENPQDTRLNISITMSYREWQAVTKALGKQREAQGEGWYPLGPVVDMLEKAMLAVEKQVPDRTETIKD